MAEIGGVQIATSGQLVGVAPLSVAQLAAAVDEVPRIYGAMTSHFTPRPPLGGTLASFDIRQFPISMVGWSAFGDRGVPIARQLTTNKTLELVHSNTPDRITNMDVWNKRMPGTTSQYTVEQLSTEKIFNAINAHKMAMEKVAFNALYEGELIDPVTGNCKYVFQDEFATTDEAGTVHKPAVNTASWSFAAATKIPTYFTSITDEMDKKNAWALGWDGRMVIYCNRTEWDGFLTNDYIKEQLNYLQMGKGIAAGMSAKDSYSGAGANGLRTDEIEEVYFRNFIIRRYRGQFSGSNFLPASHMLIVPNKIGTNVLDYGPCDRMLTPGGNITSSAAYGQNHYALQWLDPSGAGLNLDIQTNYLFSVIKPDFNWNITVTANPIT